MSKSILLFVLMFFLGFVFCPEMNAQQKDTVSSKNKKPIVVHSPSKAATMSAILPGLGQAYNKKYWKLPIVYAGIGAFGYLFVSNRKEYSIASKELIKRNDTSISKTEWTISSKYPDGYTAEDILISANQYRRNSELSMVGFLVFYSFQIVDAYVDAHLFTFDVSDDLSMKVEPTILANNKTVGISLTLGLK